MFDELKLCIAILAQAIIDAYMGKGRAKKSAQEWFKNSGYNTVVKILKSGNIRFKNIFDLPSYTWGDIPYLVSKNPFLVYYKCKPVDYLEGIKGDGILFSKGTKVVKSSKKKLYKKPIQLVHPLAVA